MNLLDYVPPQSRAQWIRDAIGITIGFVVMVAFLIVAGGPS